MNEILKTLKAMLSDEGVLSESFEFSLKRDEHGNWRLFIGGGDSFSSSMEWTGKNLEELASSLRENDEGE